MIAIALIFCFGTCGIFLLICYCHRLKSLTMKKFHAAQPMEKQSSRRNENDSDDSSINDNDSNITQSIAHLHYEEEHDDNDKFQEENCDITSPTKHKHHQNHQRERSKSRSKHKHHQKHKHKHKNKNNKDKKKKKLHKKSSHHKKCKTANANNTDLPNSLIKCNEIEDIPPPPPPSPAINKMNKSISNRNNRNNKMPQNPVSNKMHISSKSHFPSILISRDNISNCYGHGDRMRHHNYSKTQQFSLTGSYDGKYNKYKQDLELTLKPFRKSNKMINNGNNHETTTVSVDQNGVQHQHHHHIYYVNAMQHVIQSGSANKLCQPYQNIVGGISQNNELPSTIRSHAVSMSYTPVAYHPNNLQYSPNNTHWNNQQNTNYQREQHTEHSPMSDGIIHNSLNQQTLQIPNYINNNNNNVQRKRLSNISALSTVTPTHLNSDMDSTVTPTSDGPSDQSSSSSSSSISSSRNSDNSSITSSKTSRFSSDNDDNGDNDNDDTQKYKIHRTENGNTRKDNNDRMIIKGFTLKRRMNNNNDNDVVCIQKNQLSIAMSEGTNDYRDSSSETPVPEPYVQSGNDKHYQSGDIMHNSHSNMITNINKQKQAYKY